MVDTRKQIIVALDFPTEKAALEVVDKLDPRLCRLKVGITLYTRLGPAFVKLLVTKGFDVFLDLKFHDIPQQVYGACQSAASIGAWMINVHALGGQAMLEKARLAIDEFEGNQKPWLIGVTILTSMQQADLAGIGYQGTVESTVMHLAGLCKKAGLDGVVCSAHEANMIKQEYGKEFLTVTPGIRLADTQVHDQKRVMTPDRAKEQGADFLVMGRSIVSHPEPNELLREIA